MRLFFVFLCLSLATLSLASIPSAEEAHILSFSKKGETDGGTPSATGKSQATKKPVQNGKKVLEKCPRVSATKGVKTSAGAGEESLAVIDSGKDSQGSAVLSFFPKVLVELIGEYLEGFSVVLERSWLAACDFYSVAVDRERHYLITDQDVQASNHGGDKPVSLGSSDLSRYDNFHSSHDGRYLLLIGESQEQVSIHSSEKTARWLVQETGTKCLKDVTLAGGETSFAGSSFKLSANGKTLVSTLMNWTSCTWTTSVYQIAEHGKAASASKKTDIPGEARAVSRNGNRILMERDENEQLEIHDVSGDGSHLVLKIDYAGAYVGSCALSSDGSKAAIIFNDRKLCIVDVGKEKGSVSVDQLTPIGILRRFIFYSLTYDAKDRLYAFAISNLWLVDPSEHELVSLEEAQVPQGYGIQRSAASPNVDYIALLFQLRNEGGTKERQFQMVVKRTTKDALMCLCGYES